MKQGNLDEGEGAGRHRELSFLGISMNGAAMSHRDFSFARFPMNVSYPARNRMSYPARNNEKGHRIQVGYGSPGNGQ